MINKIVFISGFCFATSVVAAPKALQCDVRIIYSEGESADLVRPDYDLSLEKKISFQTTRPQKHVYSGSFLVDMNDPDDSSPGEEKEWAENEAELVASVTVDEKMGKQLVFISFLGFESFLTVRPGPFDFHTSKNFDSSSDIRDQLAYEVTLNCEEVLADSENNQ